MSPFRNSAAGFSAATFATSACRAPGLVASVSEGAVNRISPYATNTSGSDRSPPGTLNVVSAGAGPARKELAMAASRIKTMGRGIRIARCYAKETLASMKFLALTLLCALSAPGAAEAGTGEAARWRQHAESVRIVRDNWGIAHIYGKSDADAVFGMIYAQAEDDFARIERNYLNGLGRLAQAEGETAIYSDLRQRLFIDPRRLKQGYRDGPDWLKTLMVAWSDGLNYFLSKHPAVAPAVIHHYEPWMALCFTEGSIGGVIEGIDLRKLQEFYPEQPPQPAQPARALGARIETRAETAAGGSNGFAIAPSR